MNLRDKLQEEWAEAYMNHSGEGILHICPRGGKIRTSIKILEKMKKNLGRKPKVLICYPDKNIQNSWEDDIAATKYKNDEVYYVTHISLGKVIDKDYDCIVVDEIHLLSAKQKINLKALRKANKKAFVVGLSGTLSEKTEIELRTELNLPVIIDYPIEQAISDGLISDYRIHIIKVNLDNQIIVDKKKNRTEKQQHDALSWVIQKKGPSLFLNLARMRVIQNSSAKVRKAQVVLGKLKDKRVLVFCSNNKTAKELGCKIHTAKMNTQSEFEKFIKNSGKSNHYAVCKIGNTGVSFKDLDHILVCAFDSNSENLTQRICRSLILDAKNKISNIYIITSTEKTELRWLEKSLEFFDQNKIKHY